MDRLKIIQHLMAIANEIELLKPEEIEERIAQLRISSEEWQGMDMPIPIDEQFELLYLLTGRQILEALK